MYTRKLHAPLPSRRCFSAVLVPVYCGHRPLCIFDAPAEVIITHELWSTHLSTFVQGVLAFKLKYNATVMAKTYRHDVVHNSTNRNTNTATADANTHTHTHLPGLHVVEPVNARDTVADGHDLADLVVLGHRLVGVRRRAGDALLEVARELDHLEVFDTTDDAGERVSRQEAFWVLRMYDFGNRGEDVSGGGYGGDGWRGFTSQEEGFS